jgi:adenylylsulfate kinase
MLTETSTRSLVKAASWRLFGTLATTTIVYVLTGRLQFALIAGGLELTSKIVLYFLHERLWDRIPFGRKEVPPAVIWFTGLSGSGKTTVAQWVANDLRRRGFKVEHLDGDAVRDIFPNTGFTRPERDGHVRRVGYLASKLEAHGVFVVASFISPYRDSREFVRGLCNRFVEVYVSTPLEDCERRDAKGLYARARRGELKNVTGIDDPYEPPERPEVSFDARQMSVSDAGAAVVARVNPRATARLPQ